MSFGVGALYGSLPAVGDAAARARAIDARSGTRPVLITRHERIAEAIVAVEDERFYAHGALDLLSVARVIRTSLIGSGDPGGSTISQQLAKVLYHEPATLLGRLRAIGLAAKLEDRYSKAQILGMYLNSIYFGHGYYGVGAASHGYFGRSPGALTWNQASLLAGLPQAPSAFDPFRSPHRARERQAEVLAQLVDNHVLSATAARVAARTPLGLAGR